MFICVPILPRHTLSYDKREPYRIAALMVGDQLDQWTARRIITTSLGYLELYIDSSKRIDVSIALSGTSAAPYFTTHGRIDGVVESTLRNYDTHPSDWNRSLVSGWVVFSFSQARSWFHTSVLHPMGIAKNAPHNDWDITDRYLPSLRSFINTHNQSDIQRAVLHSTNKVSEIHVFEPSA